MCIESDNYSLVVPIYEQIPFFVLGKHSLFGLPFRLLPFSIFFFRFFNGDSFLFRQNSSFFGSPLFGDTLLFGGLLGCEASLFGGLFFCNPPLFGSLFSRDALLLPSFFFGQTPFFGGFFFRDPLLLGSEFFRDALLLCGDTLLFQPVLLLIIGVSSDADTGQHQNGNNGEYIRALLFPCHRTALRLLLFPLLSGDTLLFGLPFPFKTGGFGLPLLLLLPDAVAFDMFLRAGIDQLFGIELRVGENLSYFRVVHGCHHLGEGTAFFADLQLMAALLDQRCPIHRGMRNNLLELNRVEFADFGFLSGDRNSLFETVGVGFRVGFRIGFRIGFLGVPGLERGDRVSGLDALNLFGDGLWDARPC